MANGLSTKNGHVLRELSLLAQEVQAIQDFLRAAHCERGDDHLVAVVVAVGDGFGQFVERRFLVLVVAVAVGAFNEQIIRLTRNDGIVHEQRAGPSEVAGKDETGRLAVFGNGKFQKGRTENMPGIPVGDDNARMRLNRLAVFHDTELIRNLSRVIDGI